MKIEFEIKDIDRVEVIEAMASQLLTQMIYDDGGEATGYRERSELAVRLGQAVEKRIGELAEDTVRTCFDETIRARIATAVDEVLAAGWTKTDSYGNRAGETLDLKGRINEIITQKHGDSYSQPKRTLAETLVVDAVKAVFTQAFSKDIQTAQARLREQLDATIQAKFVETVKQALGLR